MCEHMHVPVCACKLVPCPMSVSHTHNTLLTNACISMQEGRAEEETRIKGKEKRKERLMEGGCVKARDETQICGGWRNGGKKMDDREAEEKVKAIWEKMMSGKV